MHKLTLAQGRMFGALYESILYGINFMLFLGLLYMFKKEKKTTLSQRLRLAAVVIVFIMCTIHLAAVMRGLYLAFFISSVPPDTFYLDHTQPVDLIQKAVYAVATLFADGLLIYRTLIIFGGNWVVTVFPLMSLCSTIALWIALIREYHISEPGTILFPHPINQLAVAAFAMSFITNIIITAMIGIRIWLAMRKFKSTGISTSFYRRFLAYSVESGLLYPLVLLITAIFFALGNNGLEILSGSNTQVLGIVPILLSLQLRLNLSAYDNAAAGTKVATRTLQFNMGPSTTSAYDVDAELHAGAVATDESKFGSTGSTNPDTMGSRTVVATNFNKSAGSEEHGEP